MTILEEYLEQIKKIKPLSPAEERELWIRYKERDEFAARQELIKSYQPLVFKLVNQITDSSSLKLDLIQEGSIGLIDAVDTYDYQRGVRFSTFALYHIRGRMLDYLDKGVKVNLPVLEREDSSLIEGMVERRILLEKVKELICELPDREKQVINRLYLDDGRPELIAAEMEISLSYLYRLQKRAVRRLRGKLANFMSQWNSQ